MSNTDSMCLYVFIWAMCEKHEFMMIAPWYMYKMLLGNMIICMICYLKPYDIIAWLWGAKVWLWEIMKCYVYGNDENAKHAKKMIYCMQKR